jgi:hypothetical protein
VTTTPKPLVLHLVWGPLGPRPLRDFLASYRGHDPGEEHDLAIVLNGVGPEQSGTSTSREELLAELQGTKYRLIELKRPVLDLVAYGQAVRAVDHQRVCILNSHSRIRCDGWLVALDQTLCRPGVGVVGATGSWAGMRSYAQYHLRLPSSYGRVWRDRPATLREFRELARERDGAIEPHGLRARAYTLRTLLDMAVYCSAFPSPHLRTNALMADRRLLVQLLPDRLARKIHAYRVESGVRGITRQVQRRGLRALVVDRSGQAYEPEDWPDSETFWQGAQGGLLVADNQTDSYQRGDADRRRVLSHFAWGERAAPAVVPPCGCAGRKCARPVRQGWI